MCPFCIELLQPQYGCALLRPDWPHPDRILATEPDAFAIAGYGPQVYPYALIVTNRHITSLAEATASERLSVLHCIDRLQMLSPFRGLAPAVFEHGGKGGSACSCLEHCHLHVISGQYPVQAWLEEEEACEPAMMDEQRGFGVGGSYLFAGRYSGGRLVGVTAQPEERTPQYFRQMLALRLGLTSWDWREGMNVNFMRDLVSEAKKSQAQGVMAAKA